jgi:Gas vesicle synthesis protein GvpL/GvpF
VIELYAVTDRPAEPLPDLAPLGELASGELAVIYGPAAEGEVSAEALWHHDQVVEALMDDRDVLPFRYGTRCTDADAAARAVAERGEELAAALERIRGAVELSLRVVVTDASGEAPKSARDYVAAKARDAAIARAIVESVHEPLSARGRASRQKPSGNGAEPLREQFGLTQEDLNLRLGPLGDLL